MNIEILIEELDRLLEKSLSIEERGMMITLVLCRKNSLGESVLMGFYLKQSISMNLNSKKVLISLQDKDFIEWDGYDKAKKAIEQEILTPQVQEVIDFSNQILGTNRKMGKILAGQILPRLGEHSLEDLKLVISNRKEVWTGDPVMEQHLCLETLMRPKNCLKYLDEAKRTSQGLGTVIAVNNNLKKGDTITFDFMDKLIPTNTYEVRLYSLVEGVRNGVGINQSLQGQEIQKLLTKQKRDINRGQFAEIEIIYYP